MEIKEEKLKYQVKFHTDFEGGYRVVAKGLGNVGEYNKATNVVHVDASLMLSPEQYDQLEKDVRESVKAKFHKSPILAWGGGKR